MLVSAVLNLNHLGRYWHWHFINISVANGIVMILMVVTFVAALLLPFPGRRERKEHRDN